MRTILISGVSSGIGSACAARLIAAGERVLGLSRRAPAVGGVIWQQADVRDACSVRNAVAGLLAPGTAIDGLICNAGIGLLGSVEEVPEAFARSVFDTNYFGTLAVLQAALPHLRARRGARVLLVGSLAGRVPLPFQAHYAASKAAIESLAFALRVELAPVDIHVSLIEPGEIRTGFTAAMLRHVPRASLYRGQLERCQSAVQRDASLAPEAKLVAALVERVLAARRPRMRYPVGPQAWLVAIARRAFPDWLNLQLIRQHFGL